MTTAATAGAAISRYEAVWAALAAGPQTSAQVVERTSLGRNTVYRLLGALAAQGVVLRERRPLPAADLYRRAAG